MLESWNFSNSPSCKPVADASFMLRASIHKTLRNWARFAAWEVLPSWTAPNSARWRTWCKWVSKYVLITADINTSLFSLLFLERLRTPFETAPFSRLTFLDLLARVEVERLGLVMEYSLWLIWATSAKCLYLAHEMPPKGWRKWTFLLLILEEDQLQAWFNHSTG